MNVMTIIEIIKFLQIPGHYAVVMNLSLMEQFQNTRSFV